MRTVIFLSFLLTLGTLFAGCYMKLNGFNTCGNWIIVVALARLICNTISINTDGKSRSIGI